MANKGLSFLYFYDFLVYFQFLLNLNLKNILYPIPD
jgi:hypothetical protein